MFLFTVIKFFLITILLGLVLGLFFKKFLVSRLISLSEKNNWQSDDVVINAINSVIVFWFFLAFSSIAVGNSELPGPEDIYQKIKSEIGNVMVSSSAHHILNSYRKLNHSAKNKTMYFFPNRAAANIAKRRELVSRHKQKVVKTVVDQEGRAICALKWQV